MSTETLVAVLGAAGTFIGAVLLAVRGLTGDRFQRKVTESAALLTGYAEQVKALRDDMAAMRTQHASDLDMQARTHDRERERWNEERERLEERIETLEAQVAAFLLRPKNSRSRASDNP